MIKKTMCKVCGYDHSPYYPWGERGLFPTYDICDCCGIEFGYEDSSDEGIINAREKWIKSSYKWHGPSPLPIDWDPINQLKIASKN